MASVPTPPPAPSPPAAAAAFAEPDEHDIEPLLELPISPEKVPWPAEGETSNPIAISCHGVYAAWIVKNGVAVWNIQESRREGFFELRGDATQNGWAIAFHPEIEDLLIVGVYTVYTLWIRGLQECKPDGANNDEHPDAGTEADQLLALPRLETSKPEHLPWIQKLEGHSRAVFGCNFSPDGSLLCTASNDDSARLWDVREIEDRFSRGGKGNVESKVTFTKHGNTVRDVAIARDNSFVVTCGDDGRAFKWDAKTGEVLHTFTPPKSALGSGWITMVALACNDKFLVTGGQSGRLDLSDVQSGTWLSQIGPSGEFKSPSVLPDGEKLLVGCNDHFSLYLLDGSTCPYLGRVASHQGVASASNVSQNGFLVTSGGRKVRLWTVAGVGGSTKSARKI